MTRRGADSTNAEYLPDGMDLYLGYVDGNYRSYDAIKARFPHALVVPIATQASGNLGTVGDGPPDNGTWPGWVAWVVRRRKAGVDPTMYTDLSSWPTAIQAFNTAKVAQPHWWIASWDKHPAMISGAVGKQYEEVPRRYDLSIFADYWPGVDPKPAGTGGTTTTTTTGGGSTHQPAPSTIARVNDMLLLEVPNNAGTGEDVYMLSGDLYVHVPDGPTFNALKAAGVPTAKVSAAFGQGITTAVASLGAIRNPGPGRIVTTTT
jgi:hypothetical protein